MDCEKSPSYCQSSCTWNTLYKWAFLSCFWILKKGMFNHIFHVHMCFLCFYQKMAANPLQRLLYAKTMSKRCCGPWGWRIVSFCLHVLHPPFWNVNFGKCFYDLNSWTLHCQASWSVSLHFLDIRAYMLAWLSRYCSYCWEPYLFSTVAMKKTLMISW